MNRLPKGESQFNQVFERYRRQAKQRDIVFSLKKNQFKKLVTSNCFYCNSRPKSIQKNIRANGEFIYNGIDRVNSSKNYTLDNCVSCCFLCNFMKRRLSQKDFYNQIEKIYRNIVVSSVA